METVNVHNVRVLLPSDEEDVHTTWPHADTLAGENISHAAYSGVDLAGHRWNGLKVSRVVFTDCRFTETVFDSCDLSGVAMDSCRLAGTRFDGTRMDGGDLRGSTAENVGGVLSLRGIRLDADQIPSLMASVASEMGWKVGP